MTLTYLITTLVTYLWSSYLASNIRICFVVLQSFRVRLVTSAHYIGNYCSQPTAAVLDKCDANF